MSEKCPPRIIKTRGHFHGKGAGTAARAGLRAAICHRAKSTRRFAGLGSASREQK